MNIDTDLAFIVLFLGSFLFLPVGMLAGAAWCPEGNMPCAMLAMFGVPVLFILVGGLVVVPILIDLRRWLAIGWGVAWAVGYTILIAGAIWPD